MNKKKRTYIDYFRKREFLIALLAIAIIAMLWILPKPSANNLSTVNISTLSNNTREVLEKYNLKIKEVRDSSLVLFDDIRRCEIYIYPDKLEFALPSVKEEYNFSIMENDTEDRYIYIGMSPNGLYRSLVYFKSEGIVYMVSCEGLEPINETYLPAADELLKAYMNIISK